MATLTKPQLQNFVDRVMAKLTSNQNLLELTLAVSSPVGQLMLDKVNAQLGTAYTMADVEETAKLVINGDL